MKLVTGGFNKQTNSSPFLIIWSNEENIFGKFYQAHYVKNCRAYDESLSHCSRCQQNFILVPYDSSELCVAVISNCKYQIGTLKETCQECNENYFLNNNVCSQNLDKTMELVLVIVLPIVTFFVLVAIAIFLYKKRQIKLIQERPDFQLLHLNLDEVTLENLKHPLWKNDYALLNSNAHICKTYIQELRMKNEVICYEIVRENEEFQNFFQLKLVTKIGSGGFGEVWKVIDKLDQVFAVKFFIFKGSKELTFLERFENMTKEHQIINKLNCDSIVRTMGITYSFSDYQPRLGIVEELLDFDLTSFLHEKNQVLKFVQKLEIAISISNGFLFIHHKGFVHHDIKPGNILMRKKADFLEIKISDFGTCLHMGENENKILQGISREYASPENILHFCFGDPFLNDPKSDIWSLGIVFYRIFMENKNVVFPWSLSLKRRSNEKFNKSIRRTIEQEMHVKNKFVKQKTTNLPWEIVTLINECLQVKIGNRPSIDDILENLTHLKHNARRFEL